MLFIWKGRPTGIFSSVSCRTRGFVVGQLYLVGNTRLDSMGKLATDVLCELRSAFVFDVRNITQYRRLLH